MSDKPRRMEPVHTRWGGDWHIVDQDGISLESCYWPENAEHGAEVLNEHNKRNGHSMRYHVEERKGRLDPAETTRRERDINAGAFDAQHHWHVRAEVAEAKVAELEREVERLRRLEPFAAHREGCLLGKLAAIEANGDRSYHPCTCGLDAARRGVDHGC